jgi:nitrate reductase NapE component
LKVLKLREAIAVHESKIAELKSQSKSANRTFLFVSLALWAAIIVAVVLVLSALF